MNMWNISFLKNTSTACIDARPVFKGFDEIMVLLHIVVIVISTPGNLLLIFVVWRNPSMHTFTNCMICNCAVSDLLSTLIPGVLNVVDTLKTHTHGWIFGSFICNFLYLCMYWSVSVTIISLTVIAVDRYFFAPTGQSLLPSYHSLSLQWIGISSSYSRVQS